MFGLIAFKATDVPATNLVENGDFSNGINGWLFSSGEATVTDNVLNFISDTNLNVYTKVTHPIIKKPQINDVVYGACYIKVADTSNIKSFSIQPNATNYRGRFAISSSPKLNEWVKLSGVSKLANESDFFTVGAETKGDGTVVEYQIKNNIYINLTKTFGVGNEPTAEQMDKLLEQFPNSWFDGAKNIFNAEHLMAMYFNKMKELDNAIVELGGNP